MDNADHSGSAPHARPRPRTAGQQLTQDLLALCALWWNQLSDAQRLAWHRAARQVRSRTRKGHSQPLDGRQFHHKINSVLARCGLPRRTDPPPQPDFGPNPVTGLHLSTRGPRLALKLRLSHPPSESLMLFASPPCNPGRSFCRDFRFLGLLPPPVRGLSDITRLYLKKFGPPPPYTRLFFRVWQQVDGWENRPGRWEAQALLPAAPSPAARPPKPRR